jgi:hypothetical protein
MGMAESTDDFGFRKACVGAEDGFEPAFKIIEVVVRDIQLIIFGSGNTDIFAVSYALVAIETNNFGTGLVGVKEMSSGGGGGVVDDDEFMGDAGFG